MLLVFNFTSTHTRVSDANERITRLKARMNDRFDAQDDKIDELDQKLTAQINKLDDKIDGISLTLTALIVALEASGAIEAVVDSQTAATSAAG